MPFPSLIFTYIYIYLIIYDNNKSIYQSSIFELEITDL